MAEAGAKAQSGETILVVEDEDLVREFLLDVLREAHFDVLEAGDGKTALGIIERNDVRIDLLLSDVVLPGLTGRELVSQALKVRPGLKVLFMTGYSREVMTRQGWVEPGVEMIQKPVTEAVLVGHIRKLLDAAPVRPPA